MQADMVFRQIYTSKAVKGLRICFTVQNQIYVFLFLFFIFD